MVSKERAYGSLSAKNSRMHVACTPATNAPYCGASFSSVLGFECEQISLDRVKNFEIIHLQLLPSPLFTMASQQPPQATPGQGPQMRLQPGQQPTPEQIAAMQRQLAVDAQKAGMTVPQFVEKLKAQAIAQQQAAQQAQQQQQQQQQQPINPGPPNPAALAVANFLKGQDLKMRTCILNGQRKDMFKGQYFALVC